jgi:hypothetical protein
MKLNSRRSTRLHQLTARRSQLNIRYPQLERLFGESTPRRRQGLNIVEPIEAVQSDGRVW